MPIKVSFYYGESPLNAEFLFRRFPGLSVNSLIVCSFQCHETLYFSFCCNKTRNFFFVGENKLINHTLVSIVLSIPPYLFQHKSLNGKDMADDGDAPADQEASVDEECVNDEEGLLAKQRKEKKELQGSRLHPHSSFDNFLHVLPMCLSFSQSAGAEEDSHERGQEEEEGSD